MVMAKIVVFGQEAVFGKVDKPAAPGVAKATL
jgi:hypothetical protein